jgi:glycosyltransferase involved in cell wall biosynthesis
MTTVQILTKNNAKTIAKTLDSIQSLNANIIVGDMGSKDRTIEICENYDAHIVRINDQDRSEGRNRLIDESPSGLKMMIEPWEVLAQGHQNVKEGYASILTGQVISKDVRFWNEGRFVNPTYERLETGADQETGVLIYSIGSRDLKEDLRLIEIWKNKDPRIAAPYYYQACCQLGLGDYEGFLKTAEHYLFLDKDSMSAIMARYYFAMVHLIYKKQARPVLQNINLCLCSRPLMAEFWCLMADVYYHLLKKFRQAKEFYENALILGKRRLATDKWPMDISKYGEYPRKMIESCDKIAETHSTYSSGS